MLPFLGYHIKTGRAAQLWVHTDQFLSERGSFRRFSNNILLKTLNNYNTWIHIAHRRKMRWRQLLFIAFLLHMMLSSSCLR